MADDRPKATFEKSRAVRRRYQRSNKRFQFTASQIARIEREEERERRAKKLREKEKQRIKDKKKKVEKEAKAREERLRQGIPDPHAPKIPASQPLLFNFIKKATPVSAEPEDREEEHAQAGSDSEGTAQSSDSDEFDNDDMIFEDEALEQVVMALEEDEKELPAEDTKASDPGARIQYDDEDEFSDCSAFDDEEAIEATVTIVQAETSVAAELPTSSFQDDTALLLEEFAHEFDPGASFDEELLKLDAH
ncbi:hypothetical protein BJY04DRAFT_190129 [Aspergillus karnatakaensis]|uniref:uncharacterized protein n=1 Tax=Aspergillus karnatakaensis TaxID=1810916 RepID=UPI003CCD1C21